MRSAIQDVADFHIACDQPVRITPQAIDASEIFLRRRLIEEEVKETLDAMEANDLVEIADGLADIIYVVIGTAHHYGIPLAEVWDEVQRSNMQKVDPLTGNVTKRPDGKILKPEGWTAPDVARIIREFGWEG